MWQATGALRKRQENQGGVRGTEQPWGEHILRARRMVMKPGLETLEEATVRPSLEHTVGEMT